jgi:hypothetical protein
MRLLRWHAIGGLTTLLQPLTVERARQRIWQLKLKKVRYRGNHPKPCAHVSK